MHKPQSSNILSNGSDNLMKQVWAIRIISFFTQENALIKYTQNSDHKLPVVEEGCKVQLNILCKL